MKKVLIVDDVEEYLRALSRALSTDFNIIAAKTLEEAKQRMTSDVALALVDVRLSEQDPANRDGILLLAWLKDSFGHVPVVMMSAYRDFDSAVDTMNFGASRFLKKPIRVQQVREIIAELTGQGS